MHVFSYLRIKAWTRQDKHFFFFLSIMRPHPAPAGRHQTLFTALAQFLQENKAPPSCLTVHFFIPASTWMKEGSQDFVSSGSDWMHSIIISVLLVSRKQKVYAVVTLLEWSWLKPSKRWRLVMLLCPVAWLQWWRLKCHEWANHWNLSHLNIKSIKPVWDDFCFVRGKQSVVIKGKQQYSDLLWHSDQDWSVFRALIVLSHHHLRSRLFSQDRVNGSMLLMQNYDYRVHHPGYVFPVLSAAAKVGFVHSHASLFTRVIKRGYLSYYNLCDSSSSSDFYQLQRIAFKEEVDY